MRGNSIENIKVPTITYPIRT